MKSGLVLISIVNKQLTIDIQGRSTAWERPENRPSVGDRHHKCEVLALHGPRHACSHAEQDDVG